MHTLKHLENLTKVQKRRLFKTCKDQDIKCFCECALNIVNGTVGINLERLRRFERELKTLCKVSTSNERRRQIWCSVNGLKLIQLISWPCFIYLNNEAEDTTE